MVRVYIVDDEQMILQGISQEIDWESAGSFVCGMALSAEEALQDIQELKPDILLTDIEMPRMSGLELLVRARRLLPELRCVVISGYDKFHYAQTAIQNGACGYLLKPLNLEELHALCRKLSKEILEQRQQTGHYQQLAQLASRGRWTRQGNSLHSFLMRSETRESLLAECPDLARSPYVLWAMPGSVPSMLEEEMEQLRKITEQFVSFQHVGVRYVLWGGEKPSEVVKVWGLRADWLLTSCPLLTLEQVQSAFERMQKCLWHGFYLTKGTATLLPQAQVTPQPPDPMRLAEVIQRSPEEAETMLCSYTDACSRAMTNPDMLLIRVAETIGQAAHLLHAVEGSVTVQRVSTLCAAYQECRSYASFRTRMLEDLRQLCKAFINQGDVIYQARQYILSHYAEPLSLENLAHRYYMNASYFSTLFYKRSGVKLHDFIRNTRLQRACELLSSTDLKVAEVAERVGYDNYRRFCTVFRENYGVTAQNWRRLHGRKAENEP